MRRAKDLMLKDITSISENASLEQAAELLAQKKISGMPVINEKREIKGFISEKDIVASLFPEQVDIENPEIVSFFNLSQVIKRINRDKKIFVKDYMNKTVYFVDENVPLTDVADLMLKKSLKRIPVTKGKELVGIIERASLSQIILEKN